ncbi:hypothetical protein [uncultured Tenacibaculum sp.]|uniref:hypothetical protein n=1 Tax=uncultured Tenacibaculum sp. TaxID=174713 RepID=UPI002618ADB6|nr:hypothetical protein [uncultured Tenacibaculum sp.]
MTKVLEQVKIIDASSVSKIEGEIFDNSVRILIKKESFKNQKLKVDNYKSSLQFKKCIFNKEISVSVDDDFDIDFDISFTGCVIDSFSTDLIKTEKVSISFFSCFNERFSSRNNVPIKVDIMNCFGSYFFYNCKSVNVSYRRENIVPKIWKPILEYCKINNKNVFELKTSYSFQKVENIKLFTNIYREKKKEEKSGFELKETETVKDWRLRYNPTKQQLDSIDIGFTLNYDFEFEHKETLILSSRLQNLTLNGKTNGVLKIENTKIENVFMRNFSPTNEFKLYQIEPISKKGKFEVHESILDNSWFNNVKLNKYETVSFFKSSLSEIRFTSTTFPKVGTNFETFKSLENVHYPDIKGESYYKDQYEVFLQLRLALLNTGNTYEAQKMKSIAFNALKKNKSVGFGDKLILWLNRHSNLHGIEPLRAFCWILVFSIILYLFYLNSLGLLFGKSINWSLVANYFSFLDLTHKSNFLVEKSKLSDWAIVIDFINKLVIGYLIYQFIASFRKFGK